MNWLEEWHKNKIEIQRREESIKQFVFYNIIENQIYIATDLTWSPEIWVLLGPL